MLSSPYVRITRETLLHPDFLNAMLSRIKLNKNWNLLKIVGFSPTIESVFFIDPDEWD